MSKVPGLLDFEPVEDKPVIPRTSPQSAYDKWRRQPSTDSMSEVMKALDPIIVSRLATFSGPKPLLYLKAKKLTANAVKSYNPERSTNLSTWVVNNLQPLSRYAMSLEPVKSPELVNRRSAEVSFVRNEMHTRLGRLPTNEELADETGLSVGKLKKLLERKSFNVAESQHVDTEGAEINPAVQKVNQLPYAVEAAYAAMSPEEQMIYDWKTGSNGQPVVSNAEIARRLGMSPAGVSNLSRDIAERIARIARSV